MDLLRSWTRALLDRWLLIGTCAAGAVLLAAHAFETFGGLAPCHLCFYQRDVYWAALGAGAAGLALLRARQAWAEPMVDALLGIIFLTGAGIAAFHAGVEWKWWPGPASCTGGGSISSSDLSSFLAGAKVRAPRCDEAAWTLLGLSMAGWNSLISLALAGFSGLAARRSRDA